MKGKANLGDGQKLYLVAEEAPFFVPGKSDLEITREARRMA
jgi:hypothetical protein